MVRRHPITRWEAYDHSFSSDRVGQARRNALYPACNRAKPESADCFAQLGLPFYVDEEGLLFVGSAMHHDTFRGDIRAGITY
jgi:hypothetical protein